MKAILQLWQHKSLGSPEDEAGCSLHLSIGDQEEFARRHWSEMPENASQHFEAPFGKAVEVEVSSGLHGKIENGKAKFGLRLASIPGELQKLVPVGFTNLNEWRAEHISVLP
jgi:hypothetical protein